MSYLALYRKYRPTDFEGVIGQDHIVKTLINQIKTDKLGHAYLFTGTRGTGKTSLAKIFAKAINCKNPVNGSPCGKCDCCKALGDANNIDIVEIDAASNNGVNEIRDLKEMAQYPPVSCKYKVYIIDEVHMLSGPAFNALLKTLEEPPKHVIFILATTEVHKIPATILSRCMRFDFRLIATEVICEHISKIFDEQGKKYDKDAVLAIAKAGEGSMRDALSIADTAISYSENKLTYADVMEILGSTKFENIVELMDAIFSSNVEKLISIIDDLSNNGKSVSVLLKDLTEQIRNVLIIKTCKNYFSILGLPKTNVDLLVNVSKNCDLDRLNRIIEILSSSENDLRFSMHSRIVFESILIKCTKPSLDYNIDALMSRITQLEKKLEGASVKKEEKKEVAIKEEVSKKDNTVDFENLSAEEIKGKLLFNLRNGGSEMLWNFVQQLKIEKQNSSINIFVESLNDYNLLTREENIEKIKQAVSCYDGLNVNVVQTNDEKNMSDMDDATEKLKRIFGSDVVIVKD